MSSPRSDTIDREVALHERFRRERREAVLPLINDEIIREHQDQLQGPHGPELTRVTQCLLDDPARWRYVLVRLQADREYAIARLRFDDDGHPSATLEAERYSSHGEALHAVFVKRLAPFQAE